jgi:hypothetical protein
MNTSCIVARVRAAEPKPRDKAGRLLGSERDANADANGALQAVVLELNTGKLHDQSLIERGNVCLEFNREWIGTGSEIVSGM